MTERRETFPSGQLRSVSIRIPAGSVTVRGMASGDDQAELVVRGQAADRLDVELDGGELVVAHDQRVTFGSVTYAVELTVPPVSTIGVRTASADVRVTGVPADVRIETASGDVAVRDTERQIDIRTASGDILMGGDNDRIRIRTASGDVSLEEASRGASVVSASGDVRMERAGDAVTVKTASGQIAVDHFDGHTLSAKSISGDVRFGVPSGRTLQVDLQTLSGDMRLPSEPSSAHRSADEGPRLRLRARTVSGDIAVTAGVAPD